MFRCVRCGIAMFNQEASAKVGWSGEEDSVMPSESWVITHTRATWYLLRL